jgi:autotransporter-associated beta strand protein
LNGYIYFFNSHSYLLLMIVNLKLAPVKFRTVQGNEMKYRKCTVSIAATIVMLIGMQSFTECRGDDGGTLSGTLIMNADSPTCLPIGGDYSGTTTLNAGSIINNNVSASEFNTTRGATLTGTGTITNNTFQASTVSGATLDLNGSTALVKVGTGTFTLNGCNTYTGVTTVSAGTLQLNNASLGIAGTGITNNSALQFNNATDALTLSGNTTFGGTERWDIRSSSASSGRWQLRNGRTVSGAMLALDGSSGVINSAAGTICLSSNNSFTGATTINAGTLQLNSSILNASLGTLNIGNTSVYGSLQPNVITLSGTGTLNYDGLIAVQTGTLQLNNSVTLSGTTLAADGYGVLTKTGPGTLTLSGSVTNADTINVNSGSLVSNISVSGTTARINSSYTLAGNSLRAGNLTIDSGNLTIAPGTGTLRYGSINSSGSLTIAPGTGTLQVSSINANTLTLGAGCTLTIAALPGGSIPGALLTQTDPTESVPEPSVMVLLSIAFLAFIGFRLRPKNSAVRP